MFLILSRIQEQYRKSGRDSFRTYIRVLKSKKQKEEYFSDLTSQGSCFFVMKFRERMKGQLPLASILSMISPQRSEPFRLQVSPTSPLRIMKRLKSSYWLRMISQGCDIIIYIFQARLKTVFSIMRWKKGSWLKTLLLVSLRKSYLRYLGRFVMNLYSSSWLKFFLRLIDSSIQLPTLQLSSLDTGLFSVIFLNILM